RLEKILYQLPTQGTRVLNFSYQDEYLSKVTWSDGLLPVFEASYQSLVSSWGERESIEAPTLEERLVFADREEPIKAKTQIDGKIYWYIDLNGDAKQDRLVFDQATFDRKLREIYSGLKYSEPPVNGECEVRPTIGPGQLHQL